MTKAYEVAHTPPAHKDRPRPTEAWRERAAGMLRGVEAARKSYGQSGREPTGHAPTGAFE